MFLKDYHKVTNLNILNVFQSIEIMIIIIDVKIEFHLSDFWVWLLDVSTLKKDAGVIYYFLTASKEDGAQMWFIQLCI